ncbi:MAG: hypothetical protein NZ651_02715, partial [Candidatus Bipolaricaulota bacterium]|nr:hypothetical protein [Candidatus Bipolaricaulota bacterium]MDW8126669.1 POTRA domain-containing protein [Candidatus Bipolaricaulota bacterium]
MKIWAAFLALSVGLLASAQTFPVDRLEILGNTNIPTKEILSKLDFKVGDVIDREKVLQGKKAIEDMGYFAQVTPEVTLEDGAVVVRYQVVEYPKIEELTILGVPSEPRGGKTLWSWIQVWLSQLFNPPQVYDKRVREILAEHDVKPGQVLNMKKLEDGLRAVLDEYQKKDIGTVRVKEVIPGKNLVVHFEALPVVAHEVRGLSTVPVQEVLNLIAVPVGEVGRISQIQESLLRLTRSVYFSQAKVTPELLANGVKLVWEVEERLILPQPQIISGLAIEGTSVVPAERVPSLIGPLPQTNVTNAQVLSALRGLYDYYRREGYFLVDFVGEGVKNGVLRVRVREGKLGRIEVKGATRTADWVILRVLGLKVGQLLTEARLTVARQSLMALGYFNDVILTPTWAGEEVLLTVEV